MSAQDALNSFLNTTNDEAEFSTEFLICPEIEETGAIIKDYQLKTGTSKSNGGEEEKPWFALTLKWDIDSEEAREATKRDNVIVSGQPIFLTVKDGKLDKDNNQQLARYFKIFDINPAGMTPLEIFETLKGQYANVKVTHRQLKDKDGNYLLDDEDNVRVSAEVSAVGKA